MSTPTPSLSPAASDDDLDARIRRIRRRILDGIEATLDDLAQPVVPRAAIANAVAAKAAPRVCPQATCRRAQRCRRTFCIVRDMPSPRLPCGGRTLTSRQTKGGTA